MNDTKRHLYSVMSARSLPYASRCMASLFRNAIEPVSLTIVTDGADDAQAITAALSAIEISPTQSWTVHDKAAADERATDFYAQYPHIAVFRQGHPCWRKITDPVLFADPGSELIILDPDVYFPNRFTFERTPDTGVLLMWQHPNCLLPETTVRMAYDKTIKLADHTDIGVCQYRTPLDRDWLNGLIETLGGTHLPRSMHVESIIWAAAAERFGGGYLDPTAWRCFANTVTGRIHRRLGRPGPDVLKMLDFQNMKCFHAGGEAKHWLADAEEAAILGAPGTLDQPREIRPFTPFPRSKFENKIRVRQLARLIGLYRLIGQT